MKGNKSLSLGYGQTAPGFSKLDYEGNNKGCQKRVAPHIVHARYSFPTN